MSQYDIIALGELNVDLILNRLQGEPEVGKEIFARDMALTLGSSTAIFAANAASLGSRVAFVGMTGQDIFGQLVRSSLEQRNVATDYLITDPRRQTGATICLNYGEDRANITCQGAMDDMTLSDIDPGVFSQGRHLHISSIFMQSGVKKDLIQILQTARRHGMTTSLDTQWDPAETWNFDYAQVLPLISVFLPNEKELMMLTRSATPDQAVGKIRPYINACVVKQGSRGSLLLTRDPAADRQLPPFLNTDVVDAIGAGDSFNAGFIHKFTHGADLATCQTFGNLTGAINTTATGGTGAFSSLQAIRRTAAERFHIDINTL